MKKIINILISVVFLLSFVGIQIHKHYSNGKLYSVAIYHEADNCCDDMGKSDMNMMCMHHCSHKEQDERSCKNETEILKLDDVFISEKTSIPESNSIDLFTISLLQNTESNLYSNLPSEILNYFLPPPMERDYHAEFGVFLC